MESYWKEIRTLSLPLFNKIIVIVIFITIISIDLTSLVIGLKTSHGEIFAGALQLIVSVAPLLIAATVLMRSESGVRILMRRTEKFFLTVLPPIMAQLVEEPVPIYSPDSQASAKARAGSTKVLMNFSRGECCGELVLVAPADSKVGDQHHLWRIIVLRIELNVRRININICLPDDSIRNKIGDLADNTLHKAFKHTLGGAMTEATSAVVDGPAQSGYVFRAEPLSRTVEGRSYICLVGSKFVGRDFLWDSAEQLYFVQDFLFMIRALLAENPDLFEVVSCTGTPNTELVRSIVAGSKQ